MKNTWFNDLVICIDGKSVVFIWDMVLQYMVNVSQKYAICVKTYMVNVSLVSEVTPLKIHLKIMLIGSCSEGYI